MPEMPDAACRELLDGLHEVQRQLAVLGERLGNERDNRDMFTVNYERRHGELQAESAALRARLDSAERERQTLNSGLQAVVQDSKQMRIDLNAIAANIRWVVYLVLGLVITALVGLVVGGAMGHVRVN